MRNIGKALHDLHSHSIDNVSLLRCPPNCLASDSREWLSSHLEYFKSKWDSSKELPQEYLAAEKLLTTDKFWGKPHPLVLLHGDAMLPNFILDSDQVSGIVDLGDMGVGDARYDLCCTIWSIRFNADHYPESERDRLVSAFLAGYNSVYSKQELDEFNGMILYDLYDLIAYEEAAKPCG